MKFEEARDTHLERHGEEYALARGGEGGEPWERDFEVFALFPYVVSEHDARLRFSYGEFANILGEIAPFARVDEVSDADGPEPKVVLVRLQALSFFAEEMLDYQVI